MEDRKFQFVSVGQAGQPQNANDRKAVRKAAMQAFRRRERIERVKAFAAECAAEAQAKATASPATPPRESSIAPIRPTTTGDFDLSGQPVLLAKPQLGSEYEGKIEGSQVSEGGYQSPWTDLPKCISIGAVPNLPRDLGYLTGVSSEGTPDISYLFDYFISEIIPIMLPFEGHNQRILRIHWSRSLMRDPVILQAALSHAATHLDVVNRRGPSKATVMHTKHAMHLINQRLGSKSSIIDNELIEAVAMIASNANFTGDLVESQIHMDALKEMVRMKGGRDKLGDSKCMQAMLSWSDATSARLARSRPRFAPALTIASDAACGLASRRSPLFHMDEIFGLIEQLRKLTDLKTSIDNNNTSTVSDIMDFDAQRNALEERVLCLQYNFSTTSGLGFGEIFLDTCCIAASIYMSLTFRKFEAKFPNLRTSKQDLMAAILKAENLYASLSDLPASDFPYAESLLWVLFVGGSLALDASETTWFANRLSLVVPWTQVRSWEEAEACLKGILWVDKLRNEACDQLWNEVDRILGFNSGKVRTMEDNIFESATLLDPISVGNLEFQCIHFDLPD